jgi:hypothetical protein
VSGQFHAPATLPPGKSPRYPFYRRLGGPQSRSGRYGEVNIFYPTGTRTPAPPSRPARSQSLYRLSYPGSRFLWHSNWLFKYNLYVFQASVISTRMLLVFLSLQENVEMVPKFQAATAFFSCSLPDLYSSKWNPPAVKAPQNTFPHYSNQLIWNQNTTSPVYNGSQNLGVYRESTNSFTNTGVSKHC